MDEPVSHGSAGDSADRRFLRPEEVAAELSVTVSQVYTLMRSGQLPAVKIGKRGVWRVSREQLETYVARLVVAASERAAQHLGGATS